MYLSQYQMIPQERVKDVFQTQYGLSLSVGSVNNFNVLASSKLRELKFEEFLRSQLFATEPIGANGSFSELPSYAGSALKNTVSVSRGLKQWNFFLSQIYNQ